MELAAAQLRLERQFEPVTSSDGAALAALLLGDIDLSSVSLPELTSRTIITTESGRDLLSHPLVQSEKIAVISTAPSRSEVAADQAVALLLAGMRRLFEADSAVRSGVWRNPTLSRDLNGARVALLGPAGDTYAEIQKRLHGFYCQTFDFSEISDRLAPSKGTGKGAAEDLDAIIILDGALSHIDQLVTLGPLLTSGDPVVVEMAWPGASSGDGGRVVTLSGLTAEAESGEPTAALAVAHGRQFDEDRASEVRSALTWLHELALAHRLERPTRDDAES